MQLRTRKLRVNGRLWRPVYGSTRTVPVPLEINPTSPTVRGRNRFYRAYFRKNTGWFHALEVTSPPVVLIGDGRPRLNLEGV